MEQVIRASIRGRPAKAVLTESTTGTLSAVVWLEGAPPGDWPGAVRFDDEGSWRKAPDEDQKKALPRAFPQYGPWEWVPFWGREDWGVEGRPAK